MLHCLLGCSHSSPATDCQEAGVDRTPRTGKRKLRHGVLRSLLPNHTPQVGGGAGRGTTWARRDSARLPPHPPGATSKRMACQHHGLTLVLELGLRSSCPAAPGAEAGRERRIPLQNAEPGWVPQTRRPEVPCTPAPSELPATSPPPARPPLPGPRVASPRRPGVPAPGRAHSLRRGAAGGRTGEPASRSKPHSPLRISHCARPPRSRTRRKRENQRERTGGGAPSAGAA